MLHSAIKQRWHGWCEVSYAQDSSGTGCLLVTYEKNHTPPLVTGGAYNGYPVYARAEMPPGEVGRPRVKAEAAV